MPELSNCFGPANIKLHPCFLFKSPMIGKHTNGSIRQWLSMNRVHYWPAWNTHNTIHLHNKITFLTTHVFIFIQINYHNHYSDVIMGTLTSQITSLTIVYSTVYSGADQRKHQSSASLALVRGITWWPVNSPHKVPVARKMFPFDDVIMTLMGVAKVGSIWHLSMNNKAQVFFPL